MKKGHSYNALKVLKIVRLVLSIILLGWVLSLSILGHCEDEITPLPYYVNGYFGNNFRLTDQQMSVITPYISDTTYTFYWLGEPYEWNNNYFACQLCGYKMSANGQTVALRSSDLNYDVDYGMFDMMTDYVVLTANGGTFVKAVVLISKSTGDFSIASVTLPRVRSVALLGLGNKTINQYGYTPNVPITFNSESPFLWQGNSDQIIFTNGSPVPPTPEDDNITDDTEKPSFADYTVDWTTGKPTFDSEHPFDSLFSIMSWSFGKLADTFTGGFNYIVDSLNWSLQTFLNNVRAKFQLVIDSVNDFADMVEDKIEEIKGYLTKLVDLYDYISQPFDITKIQTAFNNMAVKTDYNSLTTLVNTAFSVFDATSEPNTFRIPIHLENIPILHINTVQYIDLGWIYDSRAIIRAFMWCVTTFSLLYTIIDALPSYLQGNDE